MTSLSHSGILWSKIGLAEQRLAFVSRRFWKHAELRRLYPRFLRELHSSMCCGLALMIAVRDRARQFASDQVAARTAKYLTIHVEEELHHDEWLLDDMAAIGMDRSQVLARAPSPAVASLVGAQYCWAFQVHPVVVLGYLAVLEGNPPLAEQLQEIEIRTGYPREAFRCLLEHAERDPFHIEELNRTLDEMPLSAEYSALIAMSAFHTIDALSCLFEDMLDSYEDFPQPSSCKLVA